MVEREIIFVGGKNGQPNAGLTRGIIIVGGKDAAARSGIILIGG